MSRGHEPLPAMTGTRINSRQRLAALPEVFTAEDLAEQHQIGQTVAHQYLARWRGYGLVLPLGRTGVHFNLQRDPTAPATKLQAALERALGRPVLPVGAVVLRNHGWLRPEAPRRLPEFAVPAPPGQNTVPGIPGLILLRRPPWWFETIERQESSAMALADMLLSAAVGLPRLDPARPCDPAEFADVTAELRRFRQTAVSRRLEEILTAAPSRDRALMGRLDPQAMVEAAMIPPPSCPGLELMG